MTTILDFRTEALALQRRAELLRLGYTVSQTWHDNHAWHLVVRS